MKQKKFRLSNDIHGPYVHLQIYTPQAHTGRRSMFMTVAQALGLSTAMWIEYHVYRRRAKMC